MSAPDKKRAKSGGNPLSDSFDMGLGSSMQGFEMGNFLPPSSSLTGAAAFGGQSGNVPLPPMSLQQSFAMQASELPPFLRDFDALYPTMSLSDVIGAPIPPPPSAPAAATDAGCPRAAEGAQGLQEDRGELEKLRRSYKGCTTKLESLEWEIKNFIPPLSQAQLKTFQASISELTAEFNGLKSEASNLLSKILLVPTQFEQWKSLSQQMDVHVLHLEVYKKEIAAVFANKYPAGGFGALVVTSQQFPDVIKQKEKKRTKGHAGHQDEAPLEVRLLTGARSSLVMVSKHVTAELIWDNDKDQKSKGSSCILNGTAVMKKQGGVASFDELRFSKGTGVKTVRLQFSCTVKTPPSLDMPGAAGTEFILASNLTQPFIVMTNESQFGDSAGKLLELEAFAGKKTVPWLRFANLLQLHYLIATRQSLSKIGRPLTKTDLAYIWQLKFNRASELSIAAVEEFWGWFGKLLHILRHQKPVPELWVKGFIFGFVSKESAVEMLRGHPVGTFLIRFSEQSAGQFAVACVAKGKAAGSAPTVKHHLVPQSTKKLSDYIMSKESFKSVLLCNVEFRVDSYAAMAKGTMSKEGAFAEFSSKKDGAPRLEGYDDLGGSDNEEGDE